MRKILVVDDEEDFCYFLKNNLETTEDFEVYICCNASESVETAKRILPDIILLDLLMPGVSGQEIAAELKNGEDTEAIPIIFLTALVTPDEMDDTNSFSSSIPVIAKPIEISVLTDIIYKLTPPQQ
jgi:CheY-like chemotaxis protein